MPHPTPSGQPLTPGSWLVPGLTLGQLRDAKVDMFCTVFIGNSATRIIGGEMVTPRGYRDV